jgi:Putative peptidoglycan binding domain
MRREPPGQIDEGRREDDWFADEGDLDWAHDPRHEDDYPEWPQEERRSTGLTRPPRVPERPMPADVARRRRMAIFGAVALAVLIVVIVVVATSGGGGGSPVVAPTTTATTQPAPTTTATTTPTPTPTPTVTVTVPQGGNLSEGDNGTEVEDLQKALAQLGLYDGKVDGDFGTGTKDAVIAFQNAHNLTPDGIVGEKTADAINQALASSSG